MRKMKGRWMTDQADVKETKHDKFIRLSEARLERAVHHILLLENLAGPGYEHEDDEGQKLVDVMQEAVDKVATAFGIEAYVPPVVAASTAPDAPAAAPEAPAVPAAPAAPAEPFPNNAEDLILLRVGQQIDQAIGEIEAGRGLEARAILMRLMTA